MFLILKTMYIVLIHWFKGAPEIVAVQRTRQYHVRDSWKYYLIDQRINNTSQWKLAAYMQKKYK